MKARDSPTIVRRRQSALLLQAPEAFRAGDNAAVGERVLLVGLLVAGGIVLGQNGKI